MPVANTEIDREMAKGLIMQGLSYAEVAKRLGCSHHLINTWAYRGGWRRAKVEVQAETRTSKAFVTNSVEAISNRCRQVLAEQTERQLAVVQGMREARRWDAITQRSAVLQTISKTACTVFGWVDNQTVSVVRVSLMSSTPDLQEQLAIQNSLASGTPPSPASPAPLPDPTSGTP